MREWIYGRYPIYETLKAGRRHAFHLLVGEHVKHKGLVSSILKSCRERDISIEFVQKNVLQNINPNNQGVALEVSSYPYRSLDDIFHLSKERNEDPFILILDSLKDPQNLASLIRTAEIVGVHGLLLPLRKTATITPAVVNASSGASEHLTITQTNLAQSIKILKKENLWVIGLDSGSDSQPFEKAQLTGPIALVVGSEELGIRPLVRKSCDLLLRLPMRGNIDSLNASAAGSVALYLTWQARDFN